MGQILLLHHLPVLPRHPRLPRPHQTASHRPRQAAALRDGQRTRTLRVRARDGDLSAQGAGLGRSGGGQGVGEIRRGGGEVCG